MTSARLGCALENGTVISSYHHYDSYPQWLGNILTSFFSSPADARSLVEGGDMQCCFSDADFEGRLILDDMERPSRLWRPMYYSDKGVTDCKPLIHQDPDDFLGYCGFGRGMHIHKQRLEYAYLYTDEAWTCYDIFRSIVLVGPFDRSATDAVEDIIRDLDLFRRVNAELMWERQLRSNL
jgi:hypothetical protein